MKIQKIMILSAVLGSMEIVGAECEDLYPFTANVECERVAIFKEVGMTFDPEEEDHHFLRNIFKIFITHLRAKPLFDWLEEKDIRSFADALSSKKRKNVVKKMLRNEFSLRDPLCPDLEIERILRNVGTNEIGTIYFKPKSQSESSRAIFNPKLNIKTHLSCVKEILETNRQPVVRGAILHQLLSTQSRARDYAVSKRLRILVEGLTYNARKYLFKELLETSYSQLATESFFTSLQTGEIDLFLTSSLYPLESEQHSLQDMLFNRHVLPILMIEMEEEGKTKLFPKIWTQLLQHNEWLGVLLQKSLFEQTSHIIELSGESAKNQKTFAVVLLLQDPILSLSHKAWLIENFFHLISPMRCAQIAWELVHTPYKNNESGRTDFPARITGLSTLQKLKAQGKICKFTNINLAKSMSTLVQDPEQLPLYPHREDHLLELLRLLLELDNGEKLSQENLMIGQELVRTLAQTPALNLNLLPDAVPAKESEKNLAEELLRVPLTKGELSLSPAYAKRKQLLSALTQDHKQEPVTRMQAITALLKAEPVLRALCSLKELCLGILNDFFMSWKKEDLEMLMGEAPDISMYNLPEAINFCKRIEQKEGVSEPRKKQALFLIKEFSICLKKGIGEVPEFLALMKSTLDQNPEREKWWDGMAGLESWKETVYNISLILEDFPFANAITYISKMISNTTRSFSYRKALALKLVQIDKDKAGEIFLEKLFKERISPESLSIFYPAFSKSFQDKEEIPSRDLWVTQMLSQEMLKGDFLSKIEKKDFIQDRLSTFMDTFFSISLEHERRQFVGQALGRPLLSKWMSDNVNRLFSHFPDLQDHFPEVKLGN